MIEIRDKYYNVEHQLLVAKNIFEMGWSQTGLSTKACEFSCKQVNYNLNGDTAFVPMAHFQVF